jgi:hypothetical protein
MSIKQMSQVWEHEFDHPEQSILLALADHADDDGAKIFPSVEYICWKTGYKERQVRRLLKKLREQRVLLVLREGGGRGYPTEYKLNLAAAPRKPPYRPTFNAPEAPQEEAEKGAILTGFPPDTPEQKGATATTEKGATATTEKGATATTPEPSLPVSKPSHTRCAAKAAGGEGARPKPPPAIRKDKQVVKTLCPTLADFLGEAHYAFGETLGLTRAQTDAISTKWRRSRRSDAAYKADWLPDWENYVEAYAENHREELARERRAEPAGFRITPEMVEQGRARTRAYQQELDERAKNGSVR